MEVESGPFAGHFWADPDEDHLVRLMKEVVANPAKAREKGQQARQDMEKNYAPKHLAQKIVARLRTIEHELNRDEGRQSEEERLAPGEVSWSDTDAEL